MEEAARYFKFDKAQLDRLLITEYPALIFSIVKVARDQRVQGLSLLAPGGGKVRDPGNEARTSLKVSDRVCTSFIWWTFPEFYIFVQHTRLLPS